MKRTLRIKGIVLTVMLAGCASGEASEPATQSRETLGTTSEKATEPLEGTWHTEITCAEMLAALERAGVATSGPGIIQDEFGLDRPPRTDDPCGGVDGTAEHTLRFEDGQFGLFAGDELGWEGSYELLDDNTFVTGPPEVATIDFRIEGDELYTRITEPAKQAPYIATWESAPWERQG